MHPARILQLLPYGCQRIIGLAVLLLLVYGAARCAAELL